MSAQWLDVGGVGSFPESVPTEAEIADTAILIVRCGAQLFAVEDRCTHDGEPLEAADVEDCQIICPRHGARFCVRTGAALTPPAYEPLRTFNVRVENGRVLVERPE